MLSAFATRARPGISGGRSHGLFHQSYRGSLSGEVVLLILGIVLFVVLVIAFFYQLTHQRSLAALLGFFILPVVMIGYPTITSIQYQNGVLTVQKTTERLLDNPADPQSRQALEEKDQQIASRASSN